MTEAPRSTVEDRMPSLEADLYGKLLETAPDAMVVIDRAGLILFTNSQGERIFGYDRNELIGRPIETLVPERLRASHRSHRSHYATQPTARPMGDDMALIAVTKSGREFPVEISLSPFTENGEPYVDAIVADITGRRRD